MQKLIMHQHGIALDEVKATCMVDRLRPHAAVLVKRYWPQIWAVAKALELRGTLSGAEIANIIGNAGKSAVS